MNREEILHYKPKNGYKLIYRYFDEDGSYIGQTKKSLKERAGKDGKNYLMHGSKWATAIQEKGYSHFNIEILEECKEIDADNKEKDFIKKFNSMKNGYNTMEGGKDYPKDYPNYNKFKNCKKQLKKKIVSSDLFNNLISRWSKDHYVRITDDITQYYDGYLEKIVYYLSKKKDVLICSQCEMDQKAVPYKPPWYQVIYKVDPSLPPNTILDDISGTKAKNRYYELLHSIGYTDDEIEHKYKSILEFYKE